MGILEAAGNFIDQLGTKLKLPEFGISEAFASGPTTNTQQAPIISPLARNQPAPYINSPTPTQKRLTYNPPPAPQRSQQPSRPTNAPPYEPNVVNQTVSYGGYTWKGNPGQGWSLEGGGSGESYEDAASRAARERLDRYNQLVTPLQKDVVSYMASRPKLTDVFNQQLADQGVPQKQEAISKFEADQAKLQSDLTTIPAGIVSERQDRGMLTAAARRRVEAQAEQPIREQLFKVGEQKQLENLGLQRAYDLIDKWMTMLQSQEKQQLEPLTQRLEYAGQEFKTEADAIAERLTGFNADRKAELETINKRIDAGYRLTEQETAQANKLKQMELDHAFTMEEQAAARKGTQVQITKDDLAQLRADIIAGGTLQDIMGAYLARNVDPDVILNLYNSNSAYGPANETQQELQTKYGVSANRVGDSGGAPTL